MVLVTWAPMACDAPTTQSPYAGAVACSLAALYVTSHDAFRRRFQHPGPFWARHYVFIAKGKPLTVILEVFNTRELAPYLGDLPAFTPT